MGYRTKATIRLLIALFLLVIGAVWLTQNSNVAQDHSRPYHLSWFVGNLDDMAQSRVVVTACCYQGPTGDYHFVPARPADSIRYAVLRVVLWWLGVWHIPVG